MHVVATTVNGFVFTWVYNQTRGSILMAMLLHGALNVSSNLIANLLGVTDVAQFMFQYYVVSSLVFGIFMLAVILFTRGRLGYRSIEEVETQAPSATRSQ
jgi:membrane protease YdiL (CAAX protease family)